MVINPIRGTGILFQPGNMAADANPNIGHEIGATGIGIRLASKKRTPIQAALMSFSVC
jgi:hypothetical protein